MTFYAYNSSGETVSGLFESKTLNAKGKQRIQ